MLFNRSHMPHPLLIPAMQALTVLAAVYRLYKMRGVNKRVKLLTDQARASFRTRKVDSAHPHLVLDGAHASIVQERTLGLNDEEFVFTLYARNGAGEYFMYKKSGEKEFIKHVPHNVAKVVLKKLYV